MCVVLFNTKITTPGEKTADLIFSELKRQSDFGVLDLRQQWIPTQRGNRRWNTDCVLQTSVGTKVITITQTVGYVKLFSKLNNRLARCLLIESNKLTVHLEKSFVDASFRKVTQYSYILSQLIRLEAIYRLHFRPLINAVCVMTYETTLTAYQL